MFDFDRPGRLTRLKYDVLGYMIFEASNGMQFSLQRYVDGFETKVDTTFTLEKLLKQPLADYLHQLCPLSHLDLVYGSMCDDPLLSNACSRAIPYHTLQWDVLQQDSGDRASCLSQFEGFARETS